MRSHPKGVHQNPVYYELIASMGWRDAAVDVSEWAQGYAASRYGLALSADASSAWRLMTDASVGGVYTSTLDISDVGTINRGAGLNLLQPASILPLGPASPPAHNATTELAVWGLLLAAATAAAAPPTTLRYDLVDAGRQCLDNLLWDVSRLVEAAFARGDAAGVETAVTAWLRVAICMDGVLSTDSNFMLGPWIADAIATAADPGEAQRNVLEYNARNQITLWGPTQGTGLEDYARKQWGGLVRSFHVRGRWSILLDAVLEAARSGTFAVDAGAVGAATQVFELAWQTNFTERFPVEAQGDAVAVSALAWAAFADPRLAEAGYSALPDSDVTKAGSRLLPQPGWTKGSGSLAFLCSADVACGGFTSEGELLARFDRASDVVAAAGVTLYARKEA